MKRLVIVLALVTVVSALGVTAAASAGTSPSPGCKGVANALGNVTAAKGKAALEVVSQKLGCGTVTPPPADPLACPSGTELATWTYDSTTTGPTGSAPWSRVSGTNVAYPTYAETQGGGYWESTVPVTGWVLESTTGQVVYVANTGSPTGGLFNQNSFDPDVLGGRTGIMFVRFCG